MSEYENLQRGIKDLNLGTVEAVYFPYQDRKTVVSVITEEFTSICPKTGLPDYATITIRYLPDNKIIELKSLKLYLTRYRDVGIFQENAVNKILDDLVKSCSPKFMMVMGEFKPRGGLKSRIVARYERIK